MNQGIWTTAFTFWKALFDKFYLRPTSLYFKPKVTTCGYLKSKIRNKFGKSSNGTAKIRYPD